MPFNIRHWAWLARNGHTECPPMELGPFPFVVMTDAEENQLRTDLVDWGILVNGQLSEESKNLLDDIAHNGEFTLRGIVLLYSKRTDAVRRFNRADDDFDLIHAVRDVPRVPFSITVTSREIITAFSTLDALIVTRRAKGEDPAAQIGPMLHAILDPEGNWKPWESTPITLPYTVVKSIADDEELSALILDDDDDFTDEDVTDVPPVDAGARRKNQVKGVEKVLRSDETPRYTMEKITSLAGKQMSAMAQMAITYQTPQGVVEPDASTGVMFFEDAGVVVSYAKGRTPESRSIRYVPGDDNGFTEGVRALITLAEPLKRR